MSAAQQIYDELKVLRELTRHRDLTWTEVSAETLRYLLACVDMHEVLNETKRLGVDSPLSTATRFADAERAKQAALSPAATKKDGA